MKKTTTRPNSGASRQIDRYIGSFDDWRGSMLEALRKTILAASPELKEEWKWGGPVWTSQGLVCAASAFKSHVKVNFFKGASLNDPSGLFNAGLDAKTMRSLDLHEGDKIDRAALKAMVKSAVRLNSLPKAKR